MSSPVTLNIIVDVLYLVILLICLLISYFHISLVMDPCIITGGSMGMGVRANSERQKRLSASK